MTQFRTKNLRPKESELLELQKKALDLLHKERRMHSKDFTGSNGDIFQYEKSLAYTLLHGKPKFDRTGTDTIGIHGYQSRFNLDNGFPLITSKKVHLKSVIHELLWLIRGETNIKYLVENRVTIWDDWPFKNWWVHQPENSDKKFPQKETKEWKELVMNDSLKLFQGKILNEPGFAEKWGELGPVYGKQWRDWSGFNMTKKGYEKLENPSDRECSPSVYIPAEYEEFSIDQIQQVVEMINKQHEIGVISRRMLVSAWNVGELPAMIKSGLPPCHYLFQFHSRLMTLEERKKYFTKISGLDRAVVEIMDDDDLERENAPVYELDLQLYQRSCDIFLGVPFNIASYAMLLMMMAQVTNTAPGTFIHDYGDLHIYSNHLDQVVEQLMRTPVAYPTMKLKNRGQKIDEFKFDDFVLSDYNPHPAIRANVAV